MPYFGCEVKNLKNKVSLKDMMVLLEFIDSESILTIVLWKKRFEKVQK